MLGALTVERIQAQADLAVVWGRDALVSARTQLINVVRGLTKARGGRLPKTASAAFVKKVPSLGAGRT